MPIGRREFLRVAAAALAARVSRRYRAAVIGLTGRGNYGHGLDTAFQKLPNVTLVALADPDPQTRARAQARAYADWRVMLRQEKPDLVSIGPRWVVDRLEMVTAAAEAGASVYMEKPIASSLEEADAIVAAAERHKIKIAVAHQMMLAPALVHLKKLVDDGLIGDLLEMRTRGKEDHRAGGEDLMVLGTHCMYLMRYFAGNPIWCSARVTVEGRDITVADRRAATEPLGPVAGDSIQASYAFPGGIQGHFASQRIHRGTGGRFQIALYGSKGAAVVHIDQDPAIYYLSDPLWSPGKTRVQWKPLPNAPGNDDPSGLRGQEAANNRIVEDLIRAIETGGEPVASIYEARAALEMIMAVYAAHLSGGRVSFPLAERRHPLGSLP